MSNSLDRLSEIFKRFPGIGPRQAKRFVYHLLNLSAGDLTEFTNLIAKLKKEIMQCPECLRFYLPASDHQREQKICELCSNRSAELKLLIVEKDTDLDNIRKTKAYNGYYFVLGGLLTILGKNPEQEIHLVELHQIIKQRVKNNKLEEVILALSANTEGDHTADILREEIRKIAPQLKITILGRGLSTGTELEYSDADTIKSALKNRSV